MLPNGLLDMKADYTLWGILGSLETLYSDVDAVHAQRLTFQPVLTIILGESCMHASR